MRLKEKVNYYWLLCQGTGIEVPENMVEKIIDFAMGEFAEKILMDLDGKILSGRWKLNNKLKEIKAELEKQSYRKLGLRIKRDKQESKTFIKFDFEGWETPIGDVETIYEKLKTLKKDGINVNVKFYSGIDGIAFWTPGNMTLTLHILVPPLNEETDFQRVLYKFEALESIVKDTIKHELRHMVQGIGGVVMELKEEFGLPPKNIRKKNIDPYGNLKGKDNEIKGITEHESRDIEFYTNLGDAVGVFNHLIKRIPANIKHLFIKIFIGDGNDMDKKKFIDLMAMFPKILNNGQGYWWFANLKSRDEERWKLAVKRFISIIGTL